MYRSEEEMIEIEWHETNDSLFIQQTMTWSFPNNKTTSSHPSFLQPRLAHTDTLTGSGQSILYIGGLEVDENGKLSPAPMNEILEYNITNSNWTLHKSPVNSTIPASRRLHSATLGKFLLMTVVVF